MIHLLEFGFALFYFFLPFKASFSLQGQWIFFSVTTVDNWLFHQNCRFLYHPGVWPVVRIAVIIGNSFPSLRIFTIWRGGRVEAVHEEASLNENAIRTTIHHRSLVTRGRLARGSVSQILRYIYAPPQNRPRSGDAKQILPLTGDATAFGHAYVISCMILFM